MQPGSRSSPFTLHGCRRNLHHFCRLLDVQAAEEPQLNDFALARIHFRKLFERIIERDQLSGSTRRHQSRFVKFDLASTRPALGVTMASRVVDENVSHDLCRYCEEMTA